MKYFLILLVLIFGFQQGMAQFGGASTYDFLNLTSSARINALGGNQVGMIDEDELSFTYYNPASLMPQMHNSISMNYIDYIADVKIGYAAYARHFDKAGTFATGIQYINYGVFKRADENGTLNGTFTAGDYALNITYARHIWNKLTAGVNLKPIYSTYDSYNSFGLGADFGLSYSDSSGNFNAGIVAKNFGTQITTYGPEKEPLPFDLQAGFSQRLAHAPFRFSVTLHNLINWELSDKATWDFDHKQENEFVIGRSDDMIKQFMRHVVFGVEFIPSENFLIGIGYNYQRREELKYGDTPGAIGLSGGFTVKVSKFRVSYAIASYHLSGTSNIFSVSTNLNEFTD